MEEALEYFNQFDGFDRFDFPEGVVRVTAGRGGEALLITGSEKTALVDCGMAYCAADMIENLNRELKGRKLDYMLLSHSHFDHLGALPFIRQAWPDAITVGAGYAHRVLSNPKAIDTINTLGEDARRKFGDKKELVIPDAGFDVDRVVADGDTISLGKEEIVVMETKGHTDCSLTFALEPQGILFLSESTGVLAGHEKMHITILKNYRDCLQSAEKCRNYGAKHLISPHYGLMPAYYNERYWELFVATAESYKEFFCDLFRQGLSDEEVLEKYAQKHWVGGRKTTQPKEAFLLNAGTVVKVFKREYEADLSP